MTESIAVAFLARGAEADWRGCCDRFVRSYQAFEAGIEHKLFVIFKGFFGSDLSLAEELFSSVDHTAVYQADDKLDIGAYMQWADDIRFDRICCLNTNSEILAQRWLLKLTVNCTDDVGLVGATGSYESLGPTLKGFPAFPNAHIRSTAFLIQRELFCSISRGRQIRDKVDAMGFESGENGLTRQILGKGLRVLVVGSNGRGYSPRWWPDSDTFRQDAQSNLLIGDNQTRTFQNATFRARRELASRSWGDYLDQSRRLLLTTSLAG